MLRSPLLPRSTRWLVAEAARPPAFSIDGRLRSGLRSLEPADDTLLMWDEDDPEVLASKSAALDELGADLYVSDQLPSTLDAEDEVLALVEAARGRARVLAHRDTTGSGAWQLHAGNLDGRI